MSGLVGTQIVGFLTHRLICMKCVTFALCYVYATVIGIGKLVIQMNSVNVGIYKNEIANTVYQD